jgi:hypothetical protein
MNRPHHHKFFPAAAKALLCALLAALLLPALLLPASAFAQPKGPARWLFVFDLSPAMKKRLPATAEALKNFFATGAEGRLQEGDNIGVWTYDQKLHIGQFPTATWDPQQAVTLATNLTAFLRSRTYAVDSRPAALQPALGGVIADSERLTVIIFCDGEGEISGTPYDRGIAQNFLDGRAERKKSQQPFVVLIRTLSGKYIGCTVNFPPGTVNIPLFLAPPPPAPATNPPPVPPPVVVPAKSAPVVVPDLIINGSAVGGMTNPPPTATTPVTNPPVAAPKTLAAPANNPVSIPAPVVVKTSPPANNPVPAPPPASPPVAVVAAPTNAANITTNTNGEPDKPTRHLVLIGVGLLAVVVVVVVLLVFRPGRRPQASLISSSMQDGPRRK